MTLVAVTSVHKTLSGLNRRQHEMMGGELVVNLILCAPGFGHTEWVMRRTTNCAVGSLCVALMTAYVDARHMGEVRVRDD